jgi:membrane associated rhomboid family serine protease
VLDLPITKTIIMINVAIFIMTEFVSKQSSSVVRQGNLGLNPIFIDDGEWWRLFTSGFLHFGLIHIGFNMYILYRLGETFEKTLGPWRYIALYTTCLLGGAAGAVVLDPMNGITGGASGAVFGLAGAAVVALRQRGVSFNNSQWGPLLLVNLVLTFTLNGVSKGGHIGGLLFGIAAGAIIMHPKRRGKSLPQDMAIMAGLMALAIIVSFAVANSRVAALTGGLG